MTSLPSEYVGIIPARYASQRFPGKPLAPILGHPMFWHVFKRATRCPQLSRVVLATDDERIRTAAEEHHVPVVMTRRDHPSGTDRVLEAAQKIGIDPDAVVINIQCDEPALAPAMLSELIAPFRNQEVQAATLARKITPQEAQNPDQVKVVFDGEGRALYFSRSPIPFHRSKAGPTYYGHIGLYAFRMDTLRSFVALQPSALEKVEKLEQLRLLENRIPIHVSLTRHTSVGVDRPEDIPPVEKLLSGETVASDGSGPPMGNSVHGAE